MLELNSSPAYRTSPDLAGLALATGGLLGGVVTVILVALDGAPSFIGSIAALAVGTVIAMMAIVAIGGPIWLLCHAFGKRGPGVAFTVGAVAGFALFLGSQTYGFGLFDLTPAGGPALLFRWLSGAATSLLLALISGGIALAMWRVAYRRD